MARAVSCIICHGEKTKTLWRQQPYRIVQCLRCGLVYQDPQPEEAELDPLYEEAYFTRNYLAYQQERLAHFHHMWISLKERLGSKGRLLDIGCGVGFFLKVASDDGWEAWGIEPSQFASNHAREAYGLNVTTGRLTGGLFPEASFDVITIWDVIAHISDPSAYLREIHRLLKREGLLVIKTPHWAPRSFAVASGLGRFLSGRGLLHVDYQLYYFNPAGLRALLAANGYAVASVGFVSEARKKSSFQPGLRNIPYEAARLAIRLSNGRESLLTIAGKSSLGD